MRLKLITFFVIFTFLFAAAVYIRFIAPVLIQKQSVISDNLNLREGISLLEEGENPLSIETLKKEYKGSDIAIEEELTIGVNYKRYLASYTSEGLKIYALLTIPQRDPSTSSGQGKPKNGWPVVIFNHGYIPPKEYRTTERYIAYTDAFSRNGYVLFKPDYRGHGNSEGQAVGGYGSNSYTIDVLNALASIKKLKESSVNKSGSNQSVIDVNNIGMWGHSMGGFITLRSMVVHKDIKASVIWGGVVASYPDLLKRWRRPSVTPPSGLSRGWRQSLIEKYGTPEKNPEFWASISANSYVKDISGPLQLHHGEEDISVPLEFSKTLYDQLKKEGKTVELYTYPGDDHNISNNLSLALERSVAFFDKYLKK